MSRFRRPDTLVDLHGIADLLDTPEGTVRKWRTRGLLPPPDYGLRVGPVWWQSTIEAWAKETGRWLY
jgi:hypothetical protein